MPMMLDLCAGLGGASEAMRARGWRVVTLDIDPAFGCDIVADLSTWHWQGDTKPDLVWLSVPCTDFAREWMPWSKTGTPPDMTLAQAARRIVDEIQPRYWVVENVRGAVPYFGGLFGRPRQSFGPFYLWGFFPHISVSVRGMRPKQSYSSSRPDLRAKVPYVLSEAVAFSIESQVELFGPAYVTRRSTVNNYPS